VSPRQQITILVCTLLAITAIVLLRHYKLPETVVIVSAGAVLIAAYLILSTYIFPDSVDESAEGRTNRSCAAPFLVPRTALSAVPDSS